MLPPQALKPVINWELAQFTTPWRLQEAFAPFKLQQQQLCNVRSPKGDRPYITSNTYLKRGRNRMCMWSNLWSLSSNQAVQAEPPSKATQDRHLGLLADPCSTELHTNICSRKICHCNNVLAAVAASQVPLPHGLASPSASFRSEAKTIKKGKHFSSCSTGAQLLNNP